MAFDRAIINKDGHQAKTNFPLKKYEDEIEKLQGAPNPAPKFSGN